MSRPRRAMVQLMHTVMGRHEDAGPVGLQIRGWMMRHVPGLLTCAEFERFVYDYQEGLLSPRERRVFEFHMELCPMCRVYFDSYLQTIELGIRICATDDEDAPEELPEELVAAILEARRAR